VDISGVEVQRLQPAYTKMLQAYKDPNHTEKARQAFLDVVVKFMKPATGLEGEPINKRAKH
jgi:hypothetical protein